MESMLDTGNTAWVLTAAAMVLLMIPGLALFYGGMVRAKSVLNMLMMVMTAAFVVMILWVLFGYSMAFGTDIGGLIGDPVEYLGLEGLMVDDPEASLPAMAFVGFQAMFAALTVGLIAGAVADRTKFGAWLFFGAVWAIIVYFPVAHWVWSSGGWIFELGVIDFAGGTAVHINAGAAALALAIVIGRRVGWPKTPMRPQNLTLVMLGAGLLWFGWFGFNAGQHLRRDGRRRTGLVGRGEVSRRTRNDSRCRVGHRGGLGSHHPGVRVGQPDRCHRHRHHRRGALRHRGGLEVQAGV
jgi:Amt family ammonium transporter